MSRKRLREDRRVDDLRSGFDPDDDELVRDRVEPPPGRRGGDTRPPPLRPAVPARDDEVLCRSCHLYVRREFVGDAVLLICRDCRR